MPRNQADIFRQRIKLKDIQAKQPMPAEDPLPEDYRGRKFGELSPLAAAMFQVNKSVPMNWLAIQELDSVVAYWKWMHLNGRCSFYPSRSNVIRLMAQIEWMVRMAAEAAYAPGGKQNEDPFVKLMFEASTKLSKLPCFGPGNPGRAGATPKKSLEQIQPESLDERT